MASDVEEADPEDEESVDFGGEEEEDNDNGRKIEHGHDVEKWPKEVLNGTERTANSKII